jgi:hypothetical protein
MSMEKVACSKQCYHFCFMFESQFAISYRYLKFFVFQDTSTKCSLVTNLHTVGTFNTLILGNIFSKFLSKFLLDLRLTYWVERSEVFMKVKIPVEVLGVVMPYNVVVGYQCFGGPCCFHL